MTKLKPCPFCGRNKVYFSAEKVDSFLLGRLVDLTYVKCSECDCRSGYGLSEEEAAKKWNRRVDND